MGLKAYSLFFAWFDFSGDGGWGLGGLYKKYLKKINENYFKKFMSRFANNENNFL